MTRSYRHTSIIGNTLCSSEKRDKRIANRAWRRIVRVKLHTGTTEALPLQREVSNVWDFGKDGKRWCSNLCREWMRK